MFMNNVTNGKSLLKALGIFTFVFLAVLLLKNYDFINSQPNGLNNLQLNKLNQILSTKEQVALIRQIVQDSLQDLLSKIKNSDIPKTSAPLINSKETNDSKLKLGSHLLQRLFHQAPDIHQNHSLRNSQLRAFKVQTTIEERQMMYTLLEVFDKTMKSHNITYFMYGGTLLGSFRHHDLVPWDDDLDVMLPLKVHKDMDKIFKPLSPDFTLYRAGGHDKFYHKSAKKASAYNWLWPYLDISYYEENSTHIKDWTKTYDKWYSYPNEIVFPLHNRPLLNLSLPAPRDTFAFLAWTYNYGSPCLMYGYSHMVEGGGPSGTTDCKSLADKFPFVEHLPHKDGVREILKFKEIEITDIVVQEPNYAISEMFNLSLKPGYKMPSNITPPPT